MGRDHIPTADRKAGAGSPGQGTTPQVAAGPCASSFATRGAHSVGLAPLSRFKTLRAWVEPGRIGPGWSTYALAKGFTIEQIHTVT